MKSVAGILAIVQGPYILLHSVHMTKKQLKDIFFNLFA